MKLLIFVGPDIIAQKYASKSSARKSLQSAAKKFKKPKGPSSLNDGHLGCNFKGRPYTQLELKEALVMTPSEYWEVMSKS